MTERERELLGYVQTLLVPCDEQTKAGIWAAVRDDVRAIQEDRFRTAGWVKQGATWSIAA